MDNQNKTVAPKILLTFALVFALFLFGCAKKKTADQNQNPTAEQATSQTDANISGQSSGQQPASDQSSQPQIGMANPAAVFCKEKGGTSKIEKMGSGDEYGVCVFADNMQCEEWAFFHDFCPAGGVKITGYTTPESTYCAILGGEYHADGKGHCTFGNGAECYVADLWNSKCPMHFNEPATGYKYKKYDGANALIGYPENDVKLVDKIDSSDEKVQLMVEVTKISDMPATAPLGYDQTTSRKDEASLLKGDFGQQVDMPVKTSEKVTKIYPDLNAKEFVVLQRFDVCDVTFQRIAIFYSNHYQVKMTLAGNAKSIIEENPSYFGENKANCGDQKVWSGDAVHEDFVKALQEGKLTGQNTGNWYNVFDVMLSGSGVVSP